MNEISLWYHSIFLKSFAIIVSTFILLSTQVMSGIKIKIFRYDIKFKYVYFAYCKEHISVIFQKFYTIKAVFITQILLCIIVRSLEKAFCWIIKLWCVIYINIVLVCMKLFIDMFSCSMNTKYIKGLYAINRTVRQFHTDLNTSIISTNPLS